MGGLVYLSLCLELLAFWTETLQRIVVSLFFKAIQDVFDPKGLDKKTASTQLTNKTNSHYFSKMFNFCVSIEKIRSMCSSFTTTEYGGYLSTPSYPMLLKPGEPAGPCRCHLEATLNSRIIFTLLESNLVCVSKAFKFFKFEWDSWLLKKLYLIFLNSALWAYIIDLNIWRLLQKTAKYMFRCDSIKAHRYSQLRV